MRQMMHTIQAPVWTQSEYGEPVKTYSEAESIFMKVQWNVLAENDANNTRFRQYELVGLTREEPAEGSLVDGKYVVGYVEKGRWNRVFMTYAEGKDRTYGTV